MVSLPSLLDELDELVIARRVEQKHHEAREAYKLTRNTVRDMDEFRWIIGDYYRHHFKHCVAPSADLPRIEATGMAENILEDYYRRQGQTIMAAFRNAQDGVEGGLRGVLDYSFAIYAACLRA